MSRALAVFGPVLRNRELRRLEVAFAGFQAAEYAVWIAMLVYAFEQGGTTTAALVAVAQLAPATLFAPVAGALADRRRPGRVLAWGYVAQAVGMGATAAVLLAAGPPLAAYALSAVAATAVTITRPAQAVLLPALARAPEDLTAANVVTGWIESATALAGPALAGALLAIGSPGVVFATFAAAAIAQAILVAPLGERAGPPAPAGADEGAAAALGAGFRALAHNAHPRTLVAFLALAYVVWGALDILIVVLAIDILGMGDAGVGYLVAAFGVGGIAGAALAVGLVGRTRLVPPILFAALVWGGSSALLGISTSTGLAILLLVLAGTGQSLLDVAGRTLLQRISPPDVLARIFGIHEGLTMAALAIGSILVPPLVEAGGDALAFAATGALLPLFALVFMRRLLAVDSSATVPIVEISLLRRLPIFRQLPPPALESLARNLVPVASPAGSAIIREGEAGDRYYAIAEGEVVVTIRGEEVARRSRGDGFGEIALLRDVPRTATVTAAAGHTPLRARARRLRHRGDRARSHGGRRGRDRGESRRRALCVRPLSGIGRRSGLESRPHEGEAMAGTAQIIEGWRKDGVRWVRFEAPDMHGTSRSKMVPIEHATGFGEDGLNMYGGAGVLDTASHVVGGTLYGEETGYADMRIVPDPETAAIVPWLEVPTARVICDAFRDGRPLEAMPRRVFARVLERCRSHGLEPLIGFEPEFYLLDGATKDRLFEGVHIFNTVRNTYVPFLQTLVDQLRAFGIDVITHNSEYSGSQFEIPFSPGKGMAGPDVCFTFKNAVKELAHVHGYVATFMAKPFTGMAGSGNHTHVSLLDADGRNVFGDEAAEHGVSELCSRFIAGNLKYARAVYTLLVPTVNCLKRRRVHTFSPTNVSWGPEDRSALVRIKGGSVESRHVEQRAPSALANPYLVGAAVLGAGMLGIEEKLELEPPATPPAEEETGRTPLPVELREALGELEACEPLRDLLGEDFIAAYTTMRRYELQRFDDHVTDWEFAEYVELF